MPNEFSGNAFLIKNATNAESTPPLKPNSKPLAFARSTCSLIHFTVKSIFLLVEI